MSRTVCGKSGLTSRAEHRIAKGLDPRVRDSFTMIMSRLQSYLKKSRLALCAPPSERWLTVKSSPMKAVLAFINETDGRLKFDIDTYATNDISDPLRLLQLIPEKRKPNKRHVGFISRETSDDAVAYYIAKMIEGMGKFERGRDSNPQSKKNRR